MPMFLFVILFGLSMDYHVFILSRIREGVDHGMSTDEAVEHGIKTTAGVVTSAALVMVCVFSSSSPCPLLCRAVRSGLGRPAVLIDATIIRGVLLPASMTACTPGVFTSSSAASSWRTACSEPVDDGHVPRGALAAKIGDHLLALGGGHARLHLDDVLSRNALFGERVARSEDEDHAERCGERYCEPKPKDDGDERTRLNRSSVGSGFGS